MGDVKKIEFVSSHSDQKSAIFVVTLKTATGYSKQHCSIAIVIDSTDLKCPFFSGKHHARLLIVCANNTLNAELQKLQLGVGKKNKSSKEHYPVVLFTDMSPENVDTQELKLTDIVVDKTEILPGIYFFGCHEKCLGKPHLSFSS